MKLHSPAPPEITRHGAASEKPLSSIEVSIAGHFGAANEAVLASSRNKAGNSDFFILPTDASTDDRFGQPQNGQRAREMLLHHPRADRFAQVDDDLLGLLGCLGAGDADVELQARRVEVRIERT